LQRPSGLAILTPRDDEGHVVALFLRTEAADAVVDGGDQIPWRQLTMRVQGLDQLLFAELVVRAIERLGDSVRVEVPERFASDVSSISNQQSAIINRHCRMSH
jgi:hypothetical protein